MGTAGKRARENSSEEDSGNVRAKKRAKKAKVARLFDSDSSDDENMARIKAGAHLTSSSGGSLTQKVRQLLPNKQMRVEMKSLGLPPAEDGGRVRGAVVSSEGDVVNWVEESVSKDRKGKMNSKS